MLRAARRKVIELKRLNGSHLGNAIVIIAVLLIPLLYAGLLTLTYQDPTNRLETMTAAIVNEDSPITADLVTGTNEAFSLGAELEEALLAPEDGDDVGFTWKSMSADQAETKMKSEDIRAILYIPADFSEKVSRLGTDQRDEAETQVLRLVTDDSINYLAGTMAKTVSEAMTNRINERGAARISDRLILSIETVRDGLVRASEGAEALEDGSGRLRVGMAALADGSLELRSGLSVLDSGARTAASGSAQLASGLGSLSEGTDEASEGAAAVAEGALRLADGASSLNEKTNQLTTGVGRLAEGVSSASAGAASLSEGAAAIDEGAKSLDDGLNREHDGAPSLKDGAASLAQGLASLQTRFSGLDLSSLDGAAQGAGQLQGGIASYTGAVDQLAAGCAAAGDTTATCQTLQGLSAQSESLLTGATRLSDGLATADSTMNGSIPAVNTALAQLASGAQGVSAGVDAAASGASQLSAGSGRVAEGAHHLDAGLSELSAGLSRLNERAPEFASGVEALDAGADRVSGGAATISEALSSLSQGTALAESNSRTLASGVGRLAEGTADASTGASLLAEGAEAAQSGATALASGTASLSEKLDEGANAIPQVNESERNRLSEVAGQVAQVDAVRLNGVVNNGAGFSPMFMSLALWVGAIALFLILPALDKRPHGERWWKSAARPAATALLLAIGQAIIMMLVVNAVGGLEAANVVGLCAMAVAASICFMAVNQACVAAFAFRGRFLSIVLLSLQITSMGATFPIETAPRFFQWIHPLLPMSYTQLSFRSLIAGAPGADGTIEKTLAMLLLWTVCAILVTLFAAKKRRGGRPLPADNALAPTAG